MSKIKYVGANPEEARRMAILWYSGKTYGEGIPYIVHVEKVVEVLRRFGFTGPEWECRGLLHDTIEDCGVSYGDINRRFGESVAEPVYYVTDEKGRNRAEKHAKTYPILRDKYEAKVLKLADRIANVEWSLATGGKLEMYQKEHSKFKEYLYIAGELEAMWTHLDKLLS